MSLSLTSCATRRAVSTTQVITDTMHVTVCDTSTLVQWRDSVRLTEREVIREHIVTLYDRQTGHPIEQTTDRDIIRDRDSLVAHLRDSLRFALHLESLAAHADSLHHEEQHATGQAALSPTQYAVRLCIVWSLLIGTIIFMVYAMRTTIRR